jgi:deoxycytidylate deaminase
MRTALLRLVLTTAIVCSCGCESGSGSDMVAASKAGATRGPTSAAVDRAGTASEEERAAREIDALVAAGRIGEAHTQARLFVQAHPDGHFTAHIVALMGVHPHREGPPRRNPVEAVKP